VAAVEALKTYGITPLCLHRILESFCFGSLFRIRRLLFRIYNADKLGLRAFSRYPQTEDNKQPLPIVSVAQVRKAGTNSKGCGQFIHPIGIVGGIISGITQAEADASRAEIEAVPQLPAGCLLY
jgi:hypothetical protein